MESSELYSYGAVGVVFLLLSAIPYLRDSQWLSASAGAFREKTETERSKEAINDLMDLAADLELSEDKRGLILCNELIWYILSGTARPAAKGK